jgi:phage gp37-like protein
VSDESSTTLTTTTADLDSHNHDPISNNLVEKVQELINDKNDTHGMKISRRSPNRDDDSDDEETGGSYH